MGFNGPTAVVEAVLVKLGIDPRERNLDCQDREYTVCRSTELPLYFELYTRGPITDDERRVLCCFLLECLNEQMQWAGRILSNQRSSTRSWRASHYTAMSSPTGPTPPIRTKNTGGRSPGLYVRVGGDIEFERRLCASAPRGAASGDSTLFGLGVDAARDRFGTSDELADNRRDLGDRVYFLRDRNHNRTEHGGLLECFWRWDGEWAHAISKALLLDREALLFDRNAHRFGELFGLPSVVVGRVEPTPDGVRVAPGHRPVG